MQIQRYGQSSFSLSGPEASVFIDPFADMSAAAELEGSGGTAVVVPGVP
jgi:L-ascorbate metabolism protein UlaG (beta-lactamase superfamily)